MGLLKQVITVINRHSGKSAMWTRPESLALFETDSGQARMTLKVRLGNKWES